MARLSSLEARVLSLVAVRDSLLMEGKVLLVVELVLMVTVRALVTMVSLMARVSGSLLGRSWNVWVKHVYRELNQIADCLAKSVVQQLEPYVILHTAPSFVQQF
ncbi:hypothetical protein ACH5RR_001245 [Cinchona calisaya]|uniref:RNase H type-1 domain-containing protein n=1 Tax=Cinchona calisaya TaxID=153742 RepID=A0ABD3B351_9GENT